MSQMSIFKISENWQFSPSMKKKKKKNVPVKTDQAGHFPSLIRVFTVHMYKP